MSFLLITPILPQKVCQPPTKATSFAGHHLNSAGSDDVQLILSSLLGRDPGKTGTDTVIPANVCPRKRLTSHTQHIQRENPRGYLICPGNCGDVITIKHTGILILRYFKLYSHWIVLRKYCVLITRTCRDFLLTLGRCSCGANCLFDGKMWVCTLFGSL